FRIGEVRKIARAAFDAVHLFVHLAMQEFDLALGFVRIIVLAIDPLILDVEARVAGGGRLECARVERRGVCAGGGSAPMGAREGIPDCRRISSISSSVNSASRRSVTLTPRYAWLRVPSALCGPEGGTARSAAIAWERNRIARATLSTTRPSSRARRLIHRLP